jgi:hypothetical protein
MADVIRTAYKPYPGSNVGKVVAYGAGRQLSTRWNQALSSDKNHARAATRLALSLGVVLGDEIGSNDPGTRRTFATGTS